MVIASLKYFGPVLLGGLTGDIVSKTSPMLATTIGESTGVAIGLVGGLLAASWIFSSRATKIEEAGRINTENIAKLTEAVNGLHDFMITRPCMLPQQQQNNLCSVPSVQKPAATTAAQPQQKSSIMKKLGFALIGLLAIVLWSGAILMTTGCNTGISGVQVGGTYDPGTHQVGGSVAITFAQKPAQEVTDALAKAGAVASTKAARGKVVYVMPAEYSADQVKAIALAIKNGAVVSSSK